MSASASVSAIMEPLNIDLRSREPSYAQLARQLRERIASGEIGPDEPLPSLSQIAQQTNLAPGTIRKAIKVLTDEGVAYTVPGRGSFAAPR